MLCIRTVHPPVQPVYYLNVMHVVDTTGGSEGTVLRNRKVENDGRY